MDKREIIEAVRRIVVKHLGSGFELWLFGSWATGSATNTSDIDIGIAGSTKVPWQAMASILNDVEQIKTLRKIDVVDLMSVSPEFRASALKSAKRVGTEMLFAK